MATPTWVTLANANQYTQINAGGSVGSFTSATDVSPGTNVPGQAFQTSPAQIYPGQMWRFMANGIWSSTSSPGVSLGVYYGGAAGSPICYGSVAATSAWTNAASVPWSLLAMGKVTAVGSTTAAWQVSGMIHGLAPATGSTTGAGPVFPTGGVTLMPVYTSTAQYNSSNAQIITLAAQCTSSSSSNVITVYNWAIEYLTEP